jgi:hypothetical protein
MRHTLVCTLTLLSVASAAGIGRADWGAPVPAPSYNAAPPVVSQDVCPPCGSECRPGLLGRIRARLHAPSCSTSCSPCPAPRPGLLHRLRNRIAERRAGCAPACP